MKETAVEWLVDELILEGFNVPKVFYDKAKAMEKEQIIEAYNTSFLLRDKPYSTAEKYYNETYKQQEQ
jgi:hypothetical protein